MSQAHDFAAIGLRTITMERDAITKLLERLDDNFSRACSLLLDCKGRVVVTGMGKSGHIGNKIAATLASTGTPAFFMHPGEASHGDLGMITADDVVLSISSSGSTQEVLTLIPLIKRLGVPMIAMTGKADSALATSADVHLDISVETEACPLGLAPTSSTTVTLVLGDALAVALLEARGFSAEDFAFSHPGGALGRRLLLKVEDIMRIGDQIPLVSPNTLLTDALMEITQKGLGMTAVSGEDQQLLGVFTDGDLRRAIDKKRDLHSTPISELMTQHCAHANSDMLAAQALKLMEDKTITALPVLDDKHRLCGVLHMHDIIKAGVA